VYYIGVNRVEKGMVKRCRVGVVKCLFNQTQYFCNRVAQVTSVNLKGEGPDHWVTKVGGVAEISFVDRGYIHLRSTEGYR
jgi:hypothetical protein